MKVVRMMLAGAAVVFTASCSDGQGLTTEIEPQLSLARWTFTVSPRTADVQIGGGTQLTATVRDKQGGVADYTRVSWSSSNETVAIVDGQGFVQGLAAGTAVIHARANPLTDSAIVTVRDPQLPSDVAVVEIAPSALQVGEGETGRLVATVRDANGNVLDRPVQWSTSSESVALVSDWGMVMGMGTGMATITATAEGKSGMSVVTVGAGSPAPEVASVSVSPAASSVVRGATTQLTSTARDSSGNTMSGQTFTWSSSNAQVASVSSSGLVTGVTAGSAVISASAGGRSGIAQITVTVPATPVASVTVSPSSGSVEIGQTLQLTATTRDAAGNVLTARTVTWSSTSTSVATVGTSGLVVGAGGGTATIVATSEGRSASSSITVTAPIPTVASVTVAPATASVTVGQSAQFTAAARDADGNVIGGVTFAWTSSNPGVATVNGNGTATGVAAGSATISASASGRSGSGNLTVQSAPAPSPAVLFSSDWRTALGNSQAAVTDGGKWNDGPSSDYANSMAIVGAAAEGVDFPSAHVFKVMPTALRAGWVLNQTSSLPIPAVGESRYFRWYFRLDVPHQPQDAGTHPIQDGGAISQVNWSLWIDERADGTYWADFYTSGSNNRWRPTAALRKGETYRMELGYRRVSSTHFELHLRIYHRVNGTDVLLYDDGDFRDERNGNRPLIGNNVIPFHNLNSTRVLNNGNNGITDLSQDVLYGYQASFCVRSDTWCGAYLPGGS